MSYLSLGFVAYVAVLMLIFYLLPKQSRWIALLCGSLVFYGCFSIRYLPFLLFTVLTTFSAARLLKKNHNHA